MNNPFEWMDFFAAPDQRKPWRRIVDGAAFAAAIIATIVLMFAVTVVPWVLGVRCILRSIFR